MARPMKQSSLMKQIKIYPLAKAASPPPMEFMNGSGKDIDTVFPDNFRFFEQLLAMLVEEEPLAISSGHWSDFRCRPSASRKESPSILTTRQKHSLSEAARLGGAIARVNTYVRVARHLLLFRSQVARCSGWHDVHVHTGWRSADRCE